MWDQPAWAINAKEGRPPKKGRTSICFARRKGKSRVPFRSEKKKASTHNQMKKTTGGEGDHLFWRKGGSLRGGEAKREASDRIAQKRKV